MPQTIESINHAKLTNTTIIVAINKMDKPTANPNHVMEQLTQYEQCLRNGAATPSACYCRADGETKGIEDLLESINLVAEVKELKANPTAAPGRPLSGASGRGQGPVAAILVQRGHAASGDVVIAGYVRGPCARHARRPGRHPQGGRSSMPVEITGLTEVPAAGDLFDAVEDEKLARELADRRAAEQKEQQFSAYKKVTLDNLFSQVAEGERKACHHCPRPTCRGSAEAVKQSLERSPTTRCACVSSTCGRDAINQNPTSCLPTRQCHHHRLPMSVGPRCQGGSRPGRGGAAHLAASSTTPSTM